jgi:hypothetical protein
MLLAKHIDAVILSTKEAKGFVDAILVVYSSDNHLETRNN